MGPIGPHGALMGYSCGVATTWQVTLVLFGDCSAVRCNNVRCNAVRCNVSNDVCCNAIRCNGGVCSTAATSVICPGGATPQLYPEGGIGDTRRISGIFPYFHDSLDFGKFRGFWSPGCI